MPKAATAFWASRSPSSSPIAISGERSSTYRPAKGFSITTIAAARRVGGLTRCPISIKVSSTTVTILRITTLMDGHPLERTREANIAQARLHFHLPQAETDEDHLRSCLASRRRGFRLSNAAQPPRSGHGQAIGVPQRRQRQARS